MELIEQSQKEIMGMVDIISPRHNEPKITEEEGITILHYDGYMAETYVEFIIQNDGSYTMITSNDRVVFREFGNDENIFQIEHFIEYFL